MDNKVVQTLARAFVQLGYRAVRFNFRGVGASQGQWDEGVGEVDDALAVIAACRDAALPLALGGFSFGGYVAAQAARAWPRPTRRRSAGAGRPGHLDLSGARGARRHAGHPRRGRRRRAAGATLDWARPQGCRSSCCPASATFSTAS